MFIVSAKQAGSTQTAESAYRSGFHLYRAELDKMENPEEAHSRRGAPYTFDGDSFVECVKRIRSGKGEVEVPSFDHFIGDPIKGDLLVVPRHQIILVEGIYTMLGMSLSDSDLFTFPRACVFVTVQKKKKVIACLVGTKPWFGAELEQSQEVKWLCVV